MDGLDITGSSVTRNYRFGTATPFSPQSLPSPTFHPSQSILSSLTERRHSLPFSPPLVSPNGKNAEHDDVDGSARSEGTFYQKLKIDMKHMPIGNMSISPSYRDIVLAARKGLFIIDLDDPYATPRFLPQGGTWDVADVQWNPHPARANLIVSTSSQKLLIWDLYLQGQTSIQHIFERHYRAITDINWSYFEPDIIASCGIDSWVWAWDLRQGPRPIWGLCAWDAPATQVKWNRRDTHMLASSHDDKVLIWDDRKGSLPLLTINAHQGAKIYGIDWSRKYRNEIVTCALDNTIKFWQITCLASQPDVGLDCVPPATMPVSPDPIVLPQPSLERTLHSYNYPAFGGNGDSLQHPRAVIHTKHPMWRARHLPFGYGVLGLPQRGETTLEMWTPDKPDDPIWTAEGHTDVVKEYVWRSRGGNDRDHDNREFQLITWSKDGTLRFWPIDPEVTKAAGHVSGAPITVFFPRAGAKNETFREPPPLRTVSEPVLSAPTANRGILGNVKAGVYRSRSKQGTVIVNPNAPLRGTPSSGEAGGEKPLRRLRRNTPSIIRSSSNLAARDQRHVGTIRASTIQEKSSGRPTAAGGYMTRGGKPRAAFDQNTWLSNVTVERREESGGPSAGSGPTSRLASRSRATSIDAGDVTNLERGRRGRSDSKSRGTDLGEDVMPRNLPDELAFITRKYGTRVTCERADVTKRRSCTFSLLGPWRDDNALAFIRIACEFPKDYWKPTADPRTSLPSFDLDKIAGISLKTRAYLLKKLRNIRVQRLPCLEPWLRFLLGEDEGGYAYIGGLGGQEELVWDGQDEDLAGVNANGGDASEVEDGTPLVKNTPENTIRPRRCQGVFGPSGELVCFFLTSQARIYPTGGRRTASPSPSIASRGNSSHGLPSRPLMSAVGTISHAMRGLTKLTNDGSGIPLEPEVRGKNVLSLNSFTDSGFIGPVMRSQGRDLPDIRASSDHAASRPLSSVSIKRLGSLTVLDKDLGRNYRIRAENAAALCSANAAIALRHERTDHERVWEILGRLFTPSVPPITPDMKGGRHGSMTPKMEPEVAEDEKTAVRWGVHPLACHTVNELYDIFASTRDLQMLAMLSIIILEIDRLSPKRPHDESLNISLRKSLPSQPSIPALPVTPKFHVDYFSIRPHERSRTSSINPSTPPMPWPTLPSVHNQSSFALTSPSRSSWASRFFYPTSDSSPPVLTPRPATPTPSMNRERTLSTATTIASSQDSPRASFYGIAEAFGIGRTHSIAVPKSSSGRSGNIERSPNRQGSTLLSVSGGKSAEVPSGSTPKTRSEPSPGPAPNKLNVAFASGPPIKKWLMFGGSGATPRSHSPTRSTLPAELTASKGRRKVISVTLTADDEELELYHAPLAADKERRSACIGHVIAYAEVLYQWELTAKRVELLKYIGHDVDAAETARISNGTDAQIAIDSLCNSCGADITGPPKTICEQCKHVRPKLNCSICRLPARGISFSCLNCCHVMHYKCWKEAQPIHACPTGCGCSCTVSGGSFRVDATDVHRRVFTMSSTP
ncbi:hypothetical protein FRB94_005314 [Tulasnella sp. JGI-2019a]|nr:hypothetical protein FRB94_005314 [Tulasnella sp. JGI-2019a]